MTLCVQVHVRFTKINSFLLVGKVIVLVDTLTSWKRSKVSINTCRVLHSVGRCAEMESGNHISGGQQINRCLNIYANPAVRIGKKVISISKSISLVKVSHCIRGFLTCCRQKSASIQRKCNLECAAEGKDFPSGPQG